MMKNLFKKLKVYSIYTLELMLIIVVLGFLMNFVLGGTGTTVPVTSYLNISATYPEIMNIEVNNGATVTLTPNSTKIVKCIGLVRDFNNETYIGNASGFLYNSTLGASDDNNNHYSNTSCSIDLSFDTYKGFSDDENTALLNCSFVMQYYSNPGSWNCSLFVNNTYGYTSSNTSVFSVNELLAVGLPPSISYGTVNATSVSDENFTNVSNAGNVKINLSLRGYAVTPGDGYAMNCSGGSTRNILAMYEKFNMTNSTSGILSLSEFEEAYVNLTGVSTVKRFDLDYRRQDSFDEATNVTYWRIYVPQGAAGSCQGNIEYGATKAAGS